MRTARILVVDSEPERVELLRKTLSPPHTVSFLNRSQDPVKELVERQFDIIFCKYPHPREHEIICAARDLEPTPYFIAIVENEDEAQEATSSRKCGGRQCPGANYFVPSPLIVRDINKAMKKAGFGEALRTQTDGERVETSTA